MVDTVSPAETFNRKDFEVMKHVSALRVTKRKCSDAMRLMKGYTFNVPRMKCLIDDPLDKDHKLLLLDTKIAAGTLDGVPEDVKQKVQEEGLCVSTYDMVIGYKYLGADDILRKVIPDGIDVPSSFETVGHIAHFNLRDEHQPYKHIIGQVCLDKNPSLKTVVTKVAEIGNQFRVFDMEVIAGEKNMVTEMSQHGYRYKMDFSKVFWNSRLEYEHNRLVEVHFKPGDVIADVMAGIGPFAVPAAKAGCVVWSNDLNPDSTKWLKVNIKLNKVAAAVHPFCMDGRDFIRCICATPGGPIERLDELAAVKSTDEQPCPLPEDFQVPPNGIIWQHGIMNLPRTAVEFCDAFQGAFDPSLWRGKLPLIHCYTFQKNETHEDVIKRVELALGGTLEEAPTIHTVRNVAPDKYHLCVSFRVPAAVAFKGREDGPDAKRQKTDDGIKDLSV